jgi:hypothetical protein
MPCAHACRIVIVACPSADRRRERRAAAAFACVLSTRRVPRIVAPRTTACVPARVYRPHEGAPNLRPMLLVRRNEDDGCQFVEEAVTGRALSIRSCTGQPTSARCPRGIRSATRRGDGREALTCVTHFASRDAPLERP